MYCNEAVLAAGGRLPSGASHAQEPSPPLQIVFIVFSDSQEE